MGGVSKNHSEAIAAMDFFTVPTLTFGVLYCFFVIHHDRRRILHCNVTCHPTTAWVAQQLPEAFPYNSAPKYLIFDREHTFHGEVLVVRPRSLRRLFFGAQLSPVSSSSLSGSQPKTLGFRLNGQAPAVSPRTEF
jgi:hypothetical protein